MTPDNQNTLLAYPLLDLMVRQQPLADIPNEEGYKLVAILKSNGLGMPVTVRKNKDGIHGLYDVLHRHQSISLFTGWISEQA